MTASTLRPLPGFSFEVKAPVFTDVLPRMDVPVFAGFASRGPVQVAVPIEDAAQFAAIFGIDAPLAWDVDAASAALAQLAPAVRTFFLNGGTRCWVLRLTGTPQANSLSVPGMVAVEQGNKAIAPLSLIASSPGSWSDDIELAASLDSLRFGATQWTPSTHVIALTADSDAALAAGDLLRITWRSKGVVLYAGVAAVAAQPLTGGTVRRVALSVTLADECWFDIARTPAQATGHLNAERTIPITLVSSVAGPGALVSDIELDVLVDAADAVRPGQVIDCAFGGDRLLLTVRDVLREPGASSSPPQDVAVRGDGVWLRSPVVVAGNGSVDGADLAVERLTLELWARTAGSTGNPARVSELGLADGHARHVELLPIDDVLFDPANAATMATWSDVRTPRYPAAGRASGTPTEVDGEARHLRLCIPFGVGAVPDPFIPATIPAGLPLERDGLVPFDDALFGDAALTTSMASTLINDAEYLEYRDVNHRQPTGIHRALAIEEATMISVPDVIQPGWIAMDRGAPLPPDDSPTDETDPRDTPAFIDCSAVPGRGPYLEAIGHDSTSSVELDWVGPLDTTEFVVEESLHRDWSGAIVVFQGAGNGTEIGPRRPGDYYYRVRGIGDHPTEWSNGVGVRLGAGGLRLRRPEEYHDDVLVAVHRMLLRICGARRDVMTILSLPAHYREGNALTHVQTLRAVASLNDEQLLVQPLSPGELDALSFAALYHGWVATSEDDGSVRGVAPDGPACGVIARRALARGAWIAPANELLNGVVALEQAAAPSRWLDLQQVQINALRQAARGFLVMSADTLSLDDDLRPINVRRLLMLLRRAALRLGAAYVFEPNNDAFRRMVQRGFEALLADLFQRGAFAGDSAATAYQVRMDSSLNTQRAMDDGRFIVELRVAPSRPMTFLTIRLVQTGERLTASGA